MFWPNSWFIESTPRKFHIAPENRPSQKKTVDVAELFIMWTSLHYGRIKLYGYIQMLHVWHIWPTFPLQETDIQPALGKGKSSTQKCFGREHVSSLEGPGYCKLKPDVCEQWKKPRCFWNLGDYTTQLIMWGLFHKPWNKDLVIKQPGWLMESIPAGFESRGSTA